jgi:hypothetical protein
MAMRRYGVLLGNGCDKRPPKISAYLVSKLAAVYRQLAI